ncbi:hypothetical protein ALC56_01858 [Trachymyrmex septentrionalis]|uniref:Uncharacterized protein n=1 Tax=Trachymyrmex septentrionalis TaxID=34720 RepID=A0A195FT26_9HYME|nr:hypothetical protein ALC56_01858 [Trachymyrmex septentrionalis]
MTQVEDISRHLSNDNVFNKISRRFISMNSDAIRRNNELLRPLFKELENAMRKQCPLFEKTFQKIEWAGSFYKGTRIGQPEEYDLNFVIKLPFKEKDLQIKIKKTGPAFTLVIKFPERTIDIDVVPVLAFSPRITMPPKCSRRDILQSASENRRWSAVPKPLDNSKGFKDSQHRYWRLCFYEFEKDMICSHDYGSIKPVIRQLKKLRDTQKWHSIASYYLETLCYNKKEMFHISKKKPYTFLFFTMLEELHDALHNGKIEFYWDNNYNLLEKIGPVEMGNMECRLNNVLKSIRKNIKNDDYAIAKYVCEYLHFLHASNINPYE